MDPTKSTSWRQQAGMEPLMVRETSSFALYEGHGNGPAVFAEVHASRQITFDSPTSLHSRSGGIPSLRIDNTEESQEIETVTEVKRVYYLDWTRILAIYLVITFHCVQALDFIQLWKEPKTLAVQSFRACALQVGMPLFFHISGRAQALGKHQDGICTVTWQRVLRLLVPFIVCYILLIPPYQFIHKKDEAGVPRNLLDFELQYLQPKYFLDNFDPAWLWFLPVLFIVTVVSLPLLNFAEAASFSNCAINLVVWLGLAAVFRTQLGFTWPFVLLMLLIPVVPVVTVGFVPLPAQADGDTSSSVKNAAMKQWLAIRISTFSYVFLSVLLVCNMKYTDLNPIGRFIPGVLLYMMFYIQGYFIVRWSSRIVHAFDSGSQDHSPEDVRILQSYTKYIRFYQLIVAGLVLIIIFASSPVSTGAHKVWEDDLGDAPFFPIYSASRFDDPTFAALHVLGTWAWLAFAISLAQSYLDNDIDPIIYKHATSSTMVVYLFHWMFIKFYAFYFVRDLHLMDGWWQFFQLPLTFAVGLAGSLSVYRAFLHCKCLGRLFGL
mmetsp:Transcript_106355/g.184924  ORF Transcript_106355/g.184924 Transcript_106355/m.184924 type:complete len:548 (+) Transcript_106355:36-1679(+)